MGNNIWNLPTDAEIGGKKYEIHGDFRNILTIFSYLDDPDLPDFLKWKIALGLFYEKEIPDDHLQEAMEYLSFFIRCGQPEKQNPGPRLLDWQLDAPAIIADVNKVSGTEIRSIPFLHWWTFMSWFYGIGEGQLSTILSIRSKLRKGIGLEKWERDFYRENREKVDLPKRYTQGEIEEQERLRKLLDGK